LPSGEKLAFVSLPGYVVSGTGRSCACSVTPGRWRRLPDEIAGQGHANEQHCEADRAVHTKPPGVCRRYGCRSRGRGMRAASQFPRRQLVLELLERRTQVGHRLDAPRGILAQAPHDDAAELGRHAGPDLFGRRRIFLQDGREDRRLRVAGKRALAGADFVQQRAQREDVRPRIQRFALGLFGRHVGHRAKHRAGRRLRHRLGVAGLFDDFRQPEVEYLDPAIGLEHDVGGLEIAMHDLPRVRRRAGIRDLHADADDLCGGEAARRPSLHSAVGP
jgi:hypothetical protein